VTDTLLEEAPGHGEPLDHIDEIVADAALGRQVRGNVDGGVGQNNR
jgi:hypothetical protein